MDTDTGKVWVTNFVVFVDCGRAINPMYVEGQFGGGTHMGLGYALNEGMVIDPTTGKILNPNLLDYKMFTAVDMPPLTLGLVEPIDPIGPWGSKGIAEMANNGVGPCILNAIYNAIGIRLHDNTLTPADILKALGKV